MTKFAWVRFLVQEYHLQLELGCSFFNGGCEWDEFDLIWWVSIFFGSVFPLLLWSTASLAFRGQAM